MQTNSNHSILIIISNMIVKSQSFILHITYQIQQPIDYVSYHIIWIQHSYNDSFHLLMNWSSFHSYSNNFTSFIPYTRNVLSFTIIINDIFITIHFFRSIIIELVCEFHTLFIELHWESWVNGSVILSPFNL